LAQPFCSPSCLAVRHVSDVWGLAFPNLGAAVVNFFVLFFFSFSFSPSAFFINCPPPPPPPPPPPLPQTANADKHTLSSALEQLPWPQRNHPWPACLFGGQSCHPFARILPCSFAQPVLASLGSLWRRRFALHHHSLSRRPPAQLSVIARLSYHSAAGAGVATASPPELEALA
jgi:hypothetical protein